MKFEVSEFSKLKHFKIEMPFGVFYLSETFLISEIYEGIHFNWEMIQSVMIEVVEFYGENSKIVYISNRVNSYSMSPQTWNKVQKKYNMFMAGAIVSYTKMTFMNASLEKHISKTTIKHCISLEEAIEWALNFKELN